MKVKNETKAVLVLKAINGSQVSIEPEGEKSFKKEELSFFDKAVKAYLKSGWLSEVKSDAKAAPKAKEAPVEAPKKAAPKASRKRK